MAASRDEGRRSLAPPKPVLRAGGRSRPKQGGVAIITVLLVVTLATLIVSSLFWRESVTVRSVENRLALAQVRWIELAVLDWAEVVLRVDQNSTGNVDHLGEIWALPVAETRLDETVTGGARFADSERDAAIAGQVFDAQSRLNLNNLIIDGRPSQAHREAFERLLGLLGRPESLAALLQQRLQQAYPPLVENIRLPATALPLLDVADLRSVTGFDDATVEALRPFVGFLPKTIRVGRSGIGTEDTKVNINTAPPEVLAAAIPSIDLQSARQFAEGVRQRTFFASLDVARSQFNGSPTLSADMLSVGSSFFIVTGMVRFGRVESQSESLLFRGSGNVERVWQHRY